MNTREEYATHDPRVRLALVHAIDPEVVTDRAYDGSAIPSKSLIPAGASLHGAETGLTHDPALATELINEVQADTDWDGEIHLLCDQSMQERDVCQALQGMLESVGFTVDTEYSRDKPTQVWGQRNFEVALTNQAMPDTAIAPGLWNNHNSGSGTNVTGYSNPDYDKAVLQLKASETVEQKRAAMARVQEAWDMEPAVAVLAMMSTTTAWNENVSGVVPSGAYTVLLDKAVVTE